MIRITESLDIALIEKLRTRILGVGLDDKDSLCYHQILYVEDLPVGTARFARCGTAIVVDAIAVAKELDIAYHEMLARSMIAKAIDTGCDTVVVYDGVDLYTEMGFTACGDHYEAESGNIVFNCKCKSSGGKE